MSLIACPECQQGVSSAAPACPHCGYPIAANDPMAGLAAARSTARASTRMTPKRGAGRTVMRALAILCVGLIVVVLVSDMGRVNALGEMSLGSPSHVAIIVSCVLAGMAAVAAYFGQSK